jgi:thioredoxin 1
MPVLTTAAADAAALRSALSDPEKRVVACLCAAWCDTCEDFRVTFEKLAAEDPSAAYVWLDIEDDAAVAGDVDVENFPTLAVFRGTQPLFYGVTLPQEGVVVRTLSAVADRMEPAADVPAAVLRLPGALLGKS